jgi:hypothetical protein
MCDFEKIELRQPGGEEARIDLLFDVAGQQEPALADRAEQHDRHVVDARSGVGRFDRDLPSDRPQDAQIDLVDRQSVAGSDREMRRRAVLAEAIAPRRVTGPGPAHPRLEHPRDAVPRQEQRQTGHVVLVWVGQDHRVDATVPWRDQAVELDEQPIRVRPAIDQ